MSFSAECTLSCAICLVIELNRTKLSLSELCATVFTPFRHSEFAVVNECELGCESCLAWLTLFLNVRVVRLHPTIQSRSLMPRATFHYGLNWVIARIDAIIPTRVLRRRFRRPA